MTEEATTSGVESTETSGQTEVTSGAEEIKTKEENVSYSSYKKVLSEKRNYAERVKELEQAEVERQQKKAEDDGDLQKINEHLKVKTQELEARLTETDNMIKDAKKLSAFESKLPGKIKNSRYRKFIINEHLSDIAFDPDTGGVDDVTLSNVVKTFMDEDGQAMLDIPKEERKMPTRPINKTSMVPTEKGDAKAELMEHLAKLQ